MENILVGDTVQLKSGGSVMTVESIDEGGINCIWFSDDSTSPLREYIPIETVKKVEIQK